MITKHKAFSKGLEVFSKLIIRFDKEANSIPAEAYVVYFGGVCSIYIF